jgi:signal transduction histidine kinase
MSPEAHEARDPRGALRGRIRGSLFLKILLVFVGAFAAMATYFMVTFWYFDWERERPSVQATAVNYARFVLGELADPPDTANARAVAERLGIGMRIEGPGVTWTTTPDFPRFADVDLPRAPDGMTRAGIEQGLGVSAILERGPYRYLMALQAGRTALGSGSEIEDVIDALFMIGILAGVYLLIRRLLRPVRVLSEGVERLRMGDLEVEMPTRRTDELGSLIVSFNEMARAVRERIRARDQLLLDVSHEIRSPLTRMRVALEMLPDSPVKRSVVEDIEETEAMITELLETERLDSPHGGLERSRVDLSALVREAVAAASDTPPGVELKGADAPTLAEVDPERVRILVNNVLSNALKYSNPDGPPVRVVVDTVDDQVLVSFHDHGVGISKDDLAYVFEPFYRVDRSRSKDTGGYGIGLSLAKRIAEAHGGSIEIASELGEGTSVLVALPVGGNGQARARPRWRRAQAGPAR